MSDIGAGAGARVCVPARAPRCAPPLHLVEETVTRAGSSRFAELTLSARVLSPPVVVSELRGRTRGAASMLSMHIW